LSLQIEGDTATVNIRRKNGYQNKSDANLLCATRQVLEKSGIFCL
jgi:hypothetical protein